MSSTTSENKVEPGPLARELAAQAWGRPSTSHKVLDFELAEAFAQVLQEVLSKPWLGNATTRELIDELAARSDLDYKTAGSEPEPGKLRPNPEGGDSNPT